MISDRFDLGEERVVVDRRRRANALARRIAVELAPRAWACHVIGSSEGGDVCDAGEPSKYVVVESER